MIFCNFRTAQIFMLIEKIVIISFVQYHARAHARVSCCGSGLYRSIGLKRRRLATYGAARITRG